MIGKFDTALFNTGFVSGSVTYNDHYFDDQLNVRMVLPVVLAREEPVEMILVTAAQWCVINPALVATLGLDYEENHTPETQLMIRGEIYKGKLIQASILIPAENGIDMTVEATFFVPILLPDQTWNKPNFLGLDGFLNRIRFAVDPTENVFYFGPV